MSAFEDGLLTTGQMASLNGVSEKTLRLYQDKGLLEPAYVNSSTGYRYYRIEQCSDLDTVRHLQGVGFTLTEIRDILSSRDTTRLERLLSDRIDDLHAEIERINQTIGVAEVLKRSCRMVVEPTITWQIMLERVPERTIAYCQVPDELRHAESDHDEIEWELALRELKRSLVERGFAPELFHHAGCTIPKESLLNGTFEIEKAFVLADDSLSSAYEGITTLPAGQHLTMYCDHAFDRSGQSTVYTALRRMMDYAEAKNFVVAGDYYDEILAEGTLFGYEGCDSFLKLHLPVAMRP